jgi:tRNA nucleotidyltransferase/poly(A) polymerase
MNKEFKTFIEVKTLIESIALEVKSLGGRVVYVGGFVRDEALCIDNKDIDVEVYNITPTQLKDILSNYGIVDEIGASFGVLKIHGVDIDFAMPRIERKVGEGHRGFDVSVNPFMSFEEASRRRDFTINAIMKDVLTGEIIDCHNGMRDIEAGVIKHIDDCTFIEDPLRVLRACQFASRFKFDIAPETIELCRCIELSSLPKERIFEELKKALLKAKEPSIAFEAMREMDVLEKLFPELLALIKCEQRPDYHPEGNVWVHTMMVIDELAKLRDKSKNPLGLMLSGVCHDLGKPSATKEDEDGMLKAKGHELEGVPVAGDFMSKLTTDKTLRHFVVNMVQNHMRPNTIALHGNKKTIRKLIVDTDIEEILLLAEADHKGRGISEEEKDYTAIRSWFDQRIEEVSTSPGKIDPLVTGKNLISEGIKPGVEMGEMLRKAFDLQLEGLSKEDILSILLTCKH